MCNGYYWDLGKLHCLADGLDTHLKKFIIQSQGKKKKVLGKNICVCWKRKKKIVSIFFLSEQAHMAAPFSATIHFLLKIQMSLGEEKSWVLKHRKKIN